MRVLALTFGDANQASSKYRLYQYIEPLQAFGISVEPQLASGFADWPSIASYDAILVQKKLFSVGTVKRLRHLAKRLIYEVDDAIWHPHGKPHSFITNFRTRLRLKAILSSADVTVAANEVLAEHVRQWSANVRVVPMALDERTWTFPATRDDAADPCVGWSGHPVNLPYLESIEGALVNVQRKFPCALFRIMCGESPKLRELRFQHIPFVPKQEPEIIRGFDIGLLPLPTGAFAEGKSPVKGLQYMASGAAAVLTPVGATQMMFRDGETGLFAGTAAEWETALSGLLERPERRRKMALAARHAFEQQHSLSRVTPLLAQIIMSF
jgi:glycosyltransferase involved in cell wall biosynthesis